MRVSAENSSRSQLTLSFLFVIFSKVIAQIDDFKPEKQVDRKPEEASHLVYEIYDRCDANKQVPSEKVSLFKFLVLFHYFSTIWRFRILKTKVERNRKSHWAHHAFVGSVIEEGRTLFEEANIFLFRIGLIFHLLE